MEKKYIAIAIDGPAAAGKTTQAKLLAEKLGYVYMDIGTMRRAFAIHRLWLKKDLKKKVSIEIAMPSFFLEAVRDKTGSQRIKIRDQDVTDFLLDEEVLEEESTIFADPAVCDRLLVRQREWILSNNIVLDGWDIGTEVLPDTQVKIYLDADLSVRAERRLKEYQEQGINWGINGHQMMMRAMDTDLPAPQGKIYLNANLTARMKRADDAVVIDCSNMDIEETSQAILAAVNDKIPQSGDSASDTPNSLPETENTAEKKYVTIAIDGPAGVGKTTQAKLLAKKLGYIYVDTRTILQAFAVHKLWMEKETQGEVHVKTALNTFDFKFVLDENGDQRILVRGQDVTDYLQDRKVIFEASNVFAYPSAQADLSACKMRPSLNFASNVVVEGQNIGTALLSDAQVKIYLDADLSVRAERCLKELQEDGLGWLKGEHGRQIALRELYMRDERNMSRETAPLKRTDDAVVIDCSNMDIEETSQAILAVVNDKIPQSGDSASDAPNSLPETENTTEKKYVAIAIDGPAGAGKTTQAKLLAEKLGYTYVDTGAMYRAFAVHKLWLKKEAGEEVSIETALNTFDFEFVRDENGEQRIIVCGRDVTDYLRTPEVSMEASTTSAHPAVRTALLACQRKQALSNNVVMEGRDIGTVVLPDAQVKIYLDAPLPVRAARRFMELRQAKNSDVAYSDVMLDMEKRDQQDMSRETAPLKRADDAVLVDCTCLNIEETTRVIMKVINDKISKGENSNDKPHAAEDTVDSSHQACPDADRPMDDFHRMYHNVMRHEAVCKELNELYARKNRDYGDSFHLSYLEEGIAMARIRLGDKLNRFKTLSKEEQAKVKDESIRDTLIDLANYAIMTVLELDAESDSDTTGLSARG